jgi:hypothetical protein
MNTQNTSQTAKLSFYDEKERIQRAMQSIRFDLRGADPQKALTELRALDRELTALNLSNLLENVNREQARKRTEAKLVWECEQPTEDPTNADGSFHKTKVKKYPKLAALEYARGTWENDILKSINVGGERFEMYRTNYKQGETNTYTRPATFEDFLKLNCIMVEPLTLEQYTELKSQVDQANAELEAALEKYSQTRTNLQLHSFQNWGLVSQRDTHQYKFELKTQR